MHQIKQITFSGVVADGEKITFTLSEFHEKYAVDESLLTEMLEQGLIESEVNEVDNLTVDLHALHRIQAAMRLQRDLQINMPGIVLVLDLREELEQVYQELEILRKHITQD
jgi:chaperone modulatory protein CbpM